MGIWNLLSGLAIITVQNALLDRTEAEEKTCSERPNNEANEKDHEKTEDEKKVLILGA